MKIFRIGIHKELKLPANLIEKVILTNRFIVSVMVLLFIYTLAYSALNLYLLACGMLFAFAASTGALFLNHKAKYTWARYLFLAACNFAILFSDAHFNFKVSAEVYYLPVSLLAFLIFDVSETSSLVLSLFWPLAFWFIPRIAGVDVSAFVPATSIAAENYLRFQNFFGALAITIYFSYIFLKSLAEFQKALVTSNKFTALGEMSAGIAHEINNPVSVISGKTSLLRKKIGAGTTTFEEIGKDLEKIEITASRIGKIIKGLRNFSRTGDGDPFEEIAISTIIEDVLSLCHDKLSHCGVKIQTPPLSECKTSCRPHQIGQVILNLLNNAADAVENTQNPWIKIEIKKMGHRLQIWIIDSGLGIPPKVAAKMMQPFFTTKEVGKGTGLGLSISKGILENHRGFLIYDADSTNTKFVLDLPLLESDTIGNEDSSIA